MRNDKNTHTRNSNSNRLRYLNFNTIFYTIGENTRNNAFGVVYKRIAKPVLFSFDPESVHNSLIGTGKFLGSNILTKSLTSFAFNYQNKMLEQTLSGLTFRNPVGLSAGFDKNAEVISVMEDVGFGFVEVGSITAKPSPGNPGKRLARYPERQSLWIHLGLNNKGADAIYNQIKDKKFRIPVGVSAAKTNSKETTNPKIGLEDYLYTVKLFRRKADYFTLNISCPNAYGGEDFANPILYERLAKEVHKMNLKQPVFVKLSPDLKKGNIDRIISISERYKITGFICSNLTKKHDLAYDGIEGGGLSGKAVEPKANALLKYVYGRSKGKFILIGTGGVFSAEDAYKKIKLGANLVQLITGMIYQGPQLIGDINYNLVKLLEKDGFSNIGEAVGKGISESA